MNAAAAKPSAADKLVSDFVAALSHPELVALADSKAVQARLCGLGYEVECGRCGGCGSYGPLSVQGARCFGCSGRGKVAPKLTRALCKRVQAEITPEILAAYAAARKVAAAAKRAAKGSGDRVMAAYARTLFMRHFYGAPREEGGAGNLHGDAKPAYSPLAYAIHDGEDAAVHAHRDLEFAAKRGEPGATPEAILAAEAEVARARRVQDVAFSRALASGEIAADAARSAAISRLDKSDDQAERTAAWLAGPIHRREYLARASQLLAEAAADLAEYE